VAQTRTLTCGLFLMAGIMLLSLPPRAHAASCEAIIGKWHWFTGGVVTINADGTMAHEPGNDGTWSCSDAARGRVILRWRIGGYVNSLALSADGQSLSSTDPTQSFVTAKRLGATTAKPRPKTPVEPGPGQGDSSPAIPPLK